MADWQTIFMAQAQAAETLELVRNSVREFGVTITFLFVVFFLLALLVYWLVVRTYPEQLKESRADAVKARDEAKEDREKSAAEAKVMRTEFLSTLTAITEAFKADQQKTRDEARAALAAQAETFKAILERQEKHSQESHAEICRRFDAMTSRFDALTEEVQVLSGRDRGGP